MPEGLGPRTKHCLGLNLLRLLLVMPPPWPPTYTDVVSHKLAKEMKEDEMAKDAFPAPGENPATPKAYETLFAPWLSSGTQSCVFFKFACNQPPKKGGCRQRWASKSCWLNVCVCVRICLTKRWLSLGLEPQQKGKNWLFLFG